MGDGEAAFLATLFCWRMSDWGAVPVSLDDYCVYALHLLHCYGYCVVDGDDGVDDHRLQVAVVAFWHWLVAFVAFVFV